MKMWSGRFRQPLDPDFSAWQRSFPFDRRLLPEELAASKAYARALAGVGILAGTESTEIIAGLDAIGEAVAADASMLDDPEPEDVHHFVEQQLVARVGDIGYKLHSGRSRNEQIATDLRLYVREQTDVITARLVDLCAVFVDRAHAAGDAVMPAYTHLQRAEPVLVAHWLLSYFEMFGRDIERLADGRTRVNLCPLGSGAVAGSTLALDREAIARELGFDAPTANSIDATSDRDFAIEFAQVASQIALHLSRWAEDFIIFASQEFGFVRLPESYSTGSSAMPQKLNPDLLELIRGKSGRVIGNATSLAMTTKSLPLGYNKDLQETQQPIFACADIVSVALVHATGFMRSVALDLERMRTAASAGYLNAFVAATYLANQGVPFRLAHEAVGAAVRYAIDKGCALEELSREELARFSDKFGHDLPGAMKVESVIDAHDVAGGTGRAHVKAAINAAKERLAALKGAVHAHA